MEMEFDKSMIDDFVSEAREHLETVEDDLLALEKQKDNPDPALINKVFRAIHTVKGLSGFFGLVNISKLTHVMETLLSLIRSGNILPEQRYINPLLEGVDMTNAMINDVEHNNDMDITNIYDRLAGLLAKEAPPKVKGELDAILPLSDLSGEDTGFDINEFTLKDIQPDKFLYILKYELIEFTKVRGRSPVSFVRDLMEKGDIVDAKIQIAFDDLHNGLPEGPLGYEVLYSTPVGPEDIQSVAELPAECIVEVKMDTPLKFKDETTKIYEIKTEASQATALDNLPEPALYSLKGLELKSLCKKYQKNYFLHNSKGRR